MGQHFEQPTVERSIFRNFEISNIKKTKNELFDFFLVLYVFKLIERSKYMIIFEIRNFWNFPTWKFLEFSTLEFF